jgi:hypothetical protein
MNDCTFDLGLERAGINNQAAVNNRGRIFAKISLDRVVIIV